ncbi:hypothetical protein [Halorubrum salsamenti]|uniref:hypothetical protein n=1 Tax=Halorubrum salsamenti TaxID=2583990 RepID=UPI0011A20372|nr:hypothetical protein [Halorubrum salsamenti]
MSDEESAQSVIDLSFPQFAGIFVSVAGTGTGLFAGAFRVLSQDLPVSSAAVLSGITSFVLIALLISLYNRITIERLKRGES